MVAQDLVMWSEYCEAVQFYIFHCKTVNANESYIGLTSEMRIFLQHWRQKLLLTLHETAWHEYFLALIFQSTFTHGFFKHEHLFVLISSSFTFLWSQQYISTNSVSFVSPICGGGSNISGDTEMILTTSKTRRHYITSGDAEMILTTSKMRRHYIHERLINVCPEWHKTNTKHKHTKRKQWQCIKWR